MKKIIISPDIDQPKLSSFDTIDNSTNLPVWLKAELEHTVIRQGKSTGPAGTKKSGQSTSKQSTMRGKPRPLPAIGQNNLKSTAKSTRSKVNNKPKASPRPQLPKIPTNPENEKVSQNLQHKVFTDLQNQVHNMSLELENVKNNNKEMDALKQELLDQKQQNQMMQDIVQHLMANSKNYNNDMMAFQRNLNFTPESMNLGLSGQSNLTKNAGANEVSQNSPNLDVNSTKKSDKKQSKTKIRSKSKSKDRSSIHVTDTKKSSNHPSSTSRKSSIGNSEDNDNFKKSYSLRLPKKSKSNKSSVDLDDSQSVSNISVDSKMCLLM